MSKQIVPEVAAEDVESVYADVASMIEAIDKLREGDATMERVAEKLCERFRDRITFFQEMPYLLDKHISRFVDRLLVIIKSNFSNCSIKLHTCFKFLHGIAKTRGHKGLARHMPHEVEDVSLVLRLLNERDPTSIVNWETNYILFLWLSLLLLIPLSIRRFDAVQDAGDQVETSDRIYALIQTFLTVPQKASDAAALAAANFLVRDEIFDAYAEKFINWALADLLKPDCPVNLMLSLSSALAHLFKSGKRVSFKTLGVKVLDSLQASSIMSSPHEAVVKNTSKLCQRIALLFLKPRPATWRYQRGKRYLGATNTADTMHEKEISNTQETYDEVEEFSDHLENVIELLLTGLRHDATDVRWTSAKGVGRVSERLPQELAEQVVASILELFAYGEKDNAWHGGCLALAELGRRGLILSTKLDPVVQVVRKALFYDELKGIYFSGAHVRDAACYICWSFARAYDKEAMEPFIAQLSLNLLCVSLFDREISCRRAAAAAFQEHVGRQGAFAHGIDIVTQLDYYEIGVRSRAYLEVAPFVSQFNEYRFGLIEHLLDMKIAHWDVEVRQVAAASLGLLCHDVESERVQLEVLPKIFNTWSSTGLNQKHGAVLALSHVADVLAANIPDEVVLESIRMLDVVTEKRLFRSVDGDSFRSAYCLLLQKLSKSKAKLPDDKLEAWTAIICEILQHTNLEMRKNAVNVIQLFYEAYLRDRPSMSSTFLKELLLNVKHNHEHVRSGAFEALAALPTHAFDSIGLDMVLESVLRYISTDYASNSTMVAARVAAVECCTELLMKVASVQQYIVRFFNNCILPSLSDYTSTSKGDVGYIVRRTSICCTKRFVTFSSVSNIETDSSILQQVFSQLFLLMACNQEPLRFTARDCCLDLLQSGIEIHDKDRVLSILKEFDVPLDAAVRILELNSYTSSVWLGLVDSVGGKTLHISKKAKTALSAHLRTMANNKEVHMTVINTFCEVFLAHIETERLVIPLMHTASYLSTTGHLESLATEQRKAMIKIAFARKGTSDVVKISQAGQLISNFMKFEDTARFCLGYLMVLICNRYPNVRVTIADYLNVSLLTYGDCLFGDGDLDKLEQCQTVLQSTKWNAPLEELKPVRATLCNLFGIAEPKVNATTNTSTG